MYIRKKPFINTNTNQIVNQKQQSLHNLLSIIHNTVTIPKNYSIIYNHFFEILNKVITLQFKLINNENKEDNLIPKYKKYLETKITSFFQSIRPITSIEKNTQFKTSNKASLSLCMNRNISLNHIIAKEFRKITSNRFASEKTMNKSNSLDHSICFPLQLTTSNRIKPVIDSYFNKYNEDNKAGSIVLSSKTLNTYSNYINKPIQYQDYSITSPTDITQSLFLPTNFVNKAKSKSILKTYSQTSIHKKKHMVTFDNNINNE